ncbi:MAG: hypothetical protein ACJA00_003609, partial [Myxococcota bacterium]
MDASQKCKRCGTFENAGAAVLHRHADPNPPRDSDADVATRRQLAASTCHTCARTATFTRWSSQTRWSSDRL